MPIRLQCLTNFLLFPVILIMTCAPNFQGAASQPTPETLSIEEKVGQLLMVHFHGEHANDAAEILIKQAHVGGFIYFNWANGLYSPSQVQTLSNSLQTLASETTQKIPLLIAVDQEGGVVTRLKKGFTAFPGNSAIAKTGIPFYAEKCAEAIGEELKTVGINMTLGPVVDVNVNPLNPVIGVRSFGSSPQQVTAYGQAALNGYHNSGIMTVLKHFPGHGDVTLDSHAALPIVDKSLEELKSIELYPFTQLAHQSDAIMTAHLLVPALDPFRCATLSKTVIDRILRKEIGFEGVVMTDSLVMKGFLANATNIAEACVQAFEAGSDILMLGGKQLLGHDGFELTLEEILDVYQTLVQAVYSQRISMERLNRSVERILELKSRYHLFDWDLPELSSVSTNVNTLSHKKLAREIAYRAVQDDHESTAPSIHYDRMRVAVFAPKIIQYDINLTTLVDIGKETEVMFFEDLNPSLHEIHQSKELISWADAIIVCSYNAWKNEKQAQFIESLASQEKPVTVIALRDPQDEEILNGNPDIIISTSSPDAYSIQSAVDLLTGVKNVP